MWQWIKGATFKGLGALGLGGLAIGGGTLADTTINGPDGIAGNVAESAANTLKNVDAITDVDGLFTRFARFLQNVMKAFNNIGGIVNGSVDLKTLFTSNTTTTGKATPDGETNLPGKIQSVIPDGLDQGSSLAATTGIAALGIGGVLAGKTAINRFKGANSISTVEDPMDVLREANKGSMKLNQTATSAIGDTAQAAKGGVRGLFDKVKAFRPTPGGVIKGIAVIGGASAMTMVDGATNEASAAEAQSFETTVEPTSDTLGATAEKGALGNAFQAVGGVAHGATSLAANTVGFGADALDMSVGNLARSLWNGGANLVGSENKFEYKTTLDFTRASQDLVDRGAQAVGVDLSNDYANAASNITYGAGMVAGVALTFIPSGGTSAAFGAAATGGRMASAAQKLGNTGSNMLKASTMTMVPEMP